MTVEGNLAERIHLAAAPAVTISDGRRWMLALLLTFALATVCYAVSLNAYWVGDDYNYVRPKTLETVANFFNPVGRALYRPMTWGIWAINYSLFGDVPLGWRLVQLGIHLLNVTWAALLIREITGRRTLALLAATLFAVHPAHPETVTWMAGQADINYAAAWLPALWLFVRWRRGGWQTLWWVSGLLGAISLLGKEAALTLPVMSLFIDLLFGRDWARWPGRRGRGRWRDARLWTRLLLDHSLFIGAAALMVAMRLYLYFSGQGRLMYGEAQLGFLSHGLDVVAGYLVLSTGAWQVAGDVFTWSLAVKLLVVGIAAVLAILAVKVLGRLAVFALGWSAITLLLTLQGVGNRWFYLSSLGVALIVAGLALRLVRWGHERGRNGTFPKPVMARLWIAPAAAVLLLWSVLTAEHNERWRQSGEVARGIMRQVTEMHPDPPAPSTFYVANPPYSYRRVLLFNSGFGTAVYVAYQDWTTIRSYNLAEDVAHVTGALQDPEKVGPNPVFLRFEEGRMVKYPSLRALVEADGGP